MKLNLAFAIGAGLFAAGYYYFGQTQKPAEHYVATTTALDVATDMPTETKRPVAFWTQQERIFKGETLVLNFHAPNPEYLGVIAPDGKFFFVVFPQELSEGNLKPLVDSKTFRHMSSLSIATHKLKADPYIYGVYENRPVFTKSGIYTFILGDNLHAHDSDEVHRLKIRYTHQKRSAQPVSEPVAGVTP